MIDDKNLESKVEEALSEIQRGTSEIIGLSYIKELVYNFYKFNKRFIVKAGFDPTAPDLHLGHTVLLQKLATFQKYGGNIKFLIGDFTGMIGDPSGKSETRKPLSREQILKNAKTYEEQVFKILDSTYTEVCFNSKWLGELGSDGILKLTSKFSVARMLERDDFSKRYKENLPISIVEFMYPLLQGYDSVALNCDIECGGNDQKFNLLVGRNLQRSYGLDKEQSVLMVPLLEGLDGVNKMSKSLNNYIGITESPNEMYAKTMSISDEIMWRYYELLSSISLKELNELKKGVEINSLHPKKVKEQLAFELTSRYHGENSAKQAQENFNNIFSKNGIPNDMTEFYAKSNSWICKVLVDSKILKSSSEARRDIRAGALKINGEKMTDENFKLNSGIYVLQIGKRKFLKAIIK